MAFEFIPFLSFALPTSFSPGPNNISSMAFSMSRGYVKTLPYILGIFSGTLVMMMVCAVLSYGLASLVPKLTLYLKYIGAAYIFYLAYKTMKLNIGSKAKVGVQPRFYDGAILQLVNPKAIFYGMTVYSTFFMVFLENKLYLVLSALGIATFTFIVVSVWALFGAIINKYLHHKTIKRSFTLLMTAGLVYAAIDILIS
ncbi:LysE family translocator [Saccharicrinis fermentans]|uniref:Cysteine/O-acetylserine efflux protein n=1 Tax=Saccharicrinis fermentans DSM 9555 = JCM 21142 TaxID=869213 RepID=W7Y1I4_9BACT|nr:LysE family translocator [Saccharicrinis fermentans]GAF04760.1 cysteine/O-acetylserine efflux protein [Saccharicrinis fermentans DSM 9555 = JCM 21142]